MNFILIVIIFNSVYLCVGMWAVPCRDQWHQIVLKPQLQVVKARIIMGVRNWTRVLCNRAHGLHPEPSLAPSGLYLSTDSLWIVRVICASPPTMCWTWLSYPWFMVQNFQTPPLCWSVVEVTTYFFLSDILFLKISSVYFKSNQCFFTCHFTETNLVGNTQL